MRGTAQTYAQGKRLKLARENFGIKTAAEGYAHVKRVVKMALKKNTYYQHENGNSGLGRRAADYAVAYEVPVQWLLYGRDPPDWAGGQDQRGSRTIPVIAWVAAGKFSDPDTQLPSDNETIEIGGLDPGDYFATRVRGDSMNRVANENALIVVNRADRELIKGRRYLFSCRGQTTFKRFGGKDPWRIEPESTNPAHETIFARGGEEWHVIGRVRLAINDL